MPHSYTKHHTLYPYLVEDVSEPVHGEFDGVVDSVDAVLIQGAHLVPGRSVMGTTYIYTYTAWYGLVCYGYRYAYLIAYSQETAPWFPMPS
ncbi:hypothetical protein EON63_19815 [archaeon]|nr:MAG: hypothetical protein EON63_19815 [archaeon]